MTILVASDLDRTMIFSEAAAAMPTPGVHDLVCVEHFRDQPLSYMTRAATGLLREVTDAALFVPTTTRTVEQYRRITLPGGPHRYAITSNGGNILVDSRPDEHWRAVVELRISDSGAPLDHVTGELSRRIDASWVHNFRVAEELFCYLVVDLAAVPVAFVDEWTQWANDRNWAVSVQGRKIYTVPVALCKSAAVAHLRSRLETRPECRDGVT
ncbi:HAD family hydrolase, partial [Mycolicibacterium sp.]